MNGIEIKQKIMIINLIITEKILMIKSKEINKQITNNQKWKIKS